MGLIVCVVVSWWEGRQELRVGLALNGTHELPGPRWPIPLIDESSHSPSLPINTDAAKSWVTSGIGSQIRFKDLSPVFVIIHYYQFIK